MEAEYVIQISTHLLQIHLLINAKGVFLFHGFFLLQTKSTQTLKNYFTIIFFNESTDVEYS